ncbi:hypothetical protein D0C16_23035 [Cellvibrio sp. KY-GH-1]|uniref:hypothetical protein n=1 Tax=Cellvibrio sp. KY-GH-1 TaxID=2303332 RepID=UPI001245FB14|nr:hypothetical protein [Cellvibrio sp. KY-GH-1]QEY18607.1 hypothetical protein D0C16_23035 [Cellvibrio sp. KY-GH-1]
MYQQENAFEFNAEANVFEGEQFEYEEEFASSGEVFNEGELLELTAELLEINNEEELNYFLGKLVKRAAGAIGKVARSPIGQALGGVLKTVAKKALPIAGGALGGFVGGPLGAKIGSSLAGYAGSALGLEAEFLNQEDREFEGAKQFVRIAGDTVKNALAAPGNTSPQIAAQNAVMQSTRVFAPGLLSGASPRRSSNSTSGRWVRRGRNIVLLNV